jgi:hypothetical protein
VNRISISVSQSDPETVEEQGYQTTDGQTSRAYQTTDQGSSRAYQTQDALPGDHRALQTTPPSHERTLGAGKLAPLAD